MHILFLSHYFPPEVNAPASRTYDHAKRWVQHPGVKVTVLTNHPNHPNGVLYPGYVNRWLSLENIDGIEVQRVKTYLAPNAGFGRRLLNYIFFMFVAMFASMRIAKPDVVVATSPQFFCAIAGYLVSRLKRCPFVFELRDIWPDSIITVGAMQPGFFTKQLEKLELFLYRQATLIVSVTDSFKTNLVRRGIPAAKIEVIKNGVDLSFFSPLPAPSDLIQELGAQGTFVAAYIGTIGMAHAVDKIIAAAERLQDYRDILFIIVGEGAQKQVIRQMVDAKKLKNVKLIRGVSKERVRDYYAVSDLNLVTLKKADLFTTVLPSKIFEIMAMGRPILTTVAGECRQLIEEAGSGIFIEPENIELMAETILRLSQQPETLAKFAQNGRWFVAENFSRDRLAQQYLGLLKRIAKAKVSDTA